MPIYRYRCPACSHIDEVLAKMSDPAPEVCSVCGEGPMEKAVSRTSFKLKGGGWYAEGYNSTSGPSKPEGAKAETPKADGAKSDGAKAAPAAKASEAKSSSPSPSSSGSSGD